MKSEGAKGMGWNKAFSHDRVWLEFYGGRENANYTARAAWCG